MIISWNGHCLPGQSDLPVYMLLRLKFIWSFEKDILGAKVIKILTTFNKAP